MAHIARYVSDCAVIQLYTGWKFVLTNSLLHQILQEKLWHRSLWLWVLKDLLFSHERYGQTPQEHFWGRKNGKYQEMETMMTINTQELLLTLSLLPMESCCTPSLNLKQIWLFVEQICCTCQKRLMIIFSCIRQHIDCKAG